MDVESGKGALAMIKVDNLVSMGEEFSESCNASERLGGRHSRDAGSGFLVGKG